MIRVPRQLSYRYSRNQQRSHSLSRRGSRGGGALGPVPTPGTEGPAPKALVPSSQGQKEGDTGVP